MNKLNKYQKVSKERYDEATCISANNTAYLRIGEDRTFFVLKNIPALEKAEKTITLVGREIDIERAIKRINLGKVEIK